MLVHDFIKHSYFIIYIVSVNEVYLDTFNDRVCISFERDISWSSVNTSGMILHNDEIAVLLSNSVAFIASGAWLNVTYSSDVELAIVQMFSAWSPLFLLVNETAYTPTVPVNAIFGSFAVTLLCKSLSEAFCEPFWAGFRSWSSALHLRWRKFEFSFSTMDQMPKAVSLVRFGKVRKNHNRKSSIFHQQNPHPSIAEPTQNMFNLWVTVYPIVSLPILYSARCYLWSVDVKEECFRQGAI